MGAGGWRWVKMGFAVRHSPHLQLQAQQPPVHRCKATPPTRCAAAAPPPKPGFWSQQCSRTQAQCRLQPQPLPQPQPQPQPQPLRLRQRTPARCSAVGQVPPERGSPPCQPLLHYVAELGARRVQPLAPFLRGLRHAPKLKNLPPLPAAAVPLSEKRQRCAGFLAAGAAAVSLPAAILAPAAAAEG